MTDGLLSPLLTTPRGRYLGQAVFWVASLLAAILLVQTFFTWRHDSHLTEISTPPRMALADPNMQVLDLIDEIPKWHLFGKYGVVEQSAILPVTSLQIQLVGVIKAIPEKFSSIIISESNQPGKVYHVGDVLPSSGVKIYAITKEGVVLDNSGRLEKLPLLRTPLQFQGPPKSMGDE